jgi:hypothetical protein
MTSLEKIAILGVDDNMTVQDWESLCSLLRTSASLRDLDVHFDMNKCNEAATITFARYLGGSSLVSLSLRGRFILSEASFKFLCNGVAESSTLRTLALFFSFRQGSETAGECLALAIAESSSLEAIRVNAGICSALSRTTPVRNLDFTFREIDKNIDWPHLRITRRWKPLLSVNIPLGLWQHILANVHASPETSHIPEDIIRFFLREKPDLVPAP